MKLDLIAKTTTSDHDQLHLLTINAKTAHVLCINELNLFESALLY